MTREETVCYTSDMSTANVTTSPVTTSINERIVLMMFRRGIKQQQLAEAAGVDAGTVSRKLKGRARWYVDELGAVAAALDTSIAYLTGETPDEAPVRAATPTELKNEEWARWGSNPRPAD